MRMCDKQNEFIFEFVVENATPYLQDTCVNVSIRYDFVNYVDVPRSFSYGVHVYISQLIRFAIVCANVNYFNNTNLFLTAKLSKQGCWCHKIRSVFLILSWTLRVVCVKR